MSFADAQARAAASAIARLSNASATVGGGTAFPVIFDRDTVAAIGGQITGDAPVAMALDADAAALVSHTSELAIDSGSGAVNYSLIDKRPDGTGLTLLILEIA